jgi:hypothetical protein
MAALVIVDFLMRSQSDKLWLKLKNKY